MGTKTVDDFFEGKPEAYKIFKNIKTQIDAAGPNKLSIASQISFGAKRKFAWIWLYNVTQKNPNGIPHLMLTLDKTIDDSHVKNITQISKNRWNHLIIVHTVKDAKSKWLKNLITQACNFGHK